MLPIFQILDLLLSVAFFIMIVHIVFSWLITFQVLNMRQPLVASIWNGLNQLLEPVYRPVRRFLPQTSGIDFAPLVVFLGIIILRDILLPAAARSMGIPFY
ncbi:MAG: YggT family protein [Pseudomonadota bacterium]